MKELRAQLAQWGRDMRVYVKNLFAVHRVRQVRSPSMTRFYTKYFSLRAMNPAFSPIIIRRWVLGGPSVLNSLLLVPAATRSRRRNWLGSGFTNTRSERQTYF